MQKRKSYLSLLLASFLLLFTYSFAAAQTYEISFEGGIDGKDVPRCVTADMSVFITSDDPLAGFEVIFEVGGDFTDFSVTMNSLPLTTDYVVDGNVVRMYGFMGDNPDDACIDSKGTTTIGTLHFETYTECTGAITVAGATVDDPFTHGSLFVGCDPIVEIVPDFANGLLTIINQAPEITCPGSFNVHFGETVEIDVTGSDNDNCETLTYSLEGDSPDVGSFSTTTGSIVWATGGEDVGDNTFTIRVTDKCGLYAECEVYVCVFNTPPSFGDLMWAGWVDHSDPPVTINVTGDIPVTEEIQTTLGIKLIGQVNAADQGPAMGPSSLKYSILSFSGAALSINPIITDEDNGNWSWDIPGFDMAYTGDFNLCILVDDGAKTTDEACNDESADTLCIDIHVTGITYGIETEDGGDGKNGGSGVIQGTTAVVSINLNGSDAIGGFDVLISYDASALTAMNAEPGEAITDNDGELEEFEYFTYRFVDNCGGTCPSGLLRIVGMRESNDGIINNHDLVYSGVVADINFHVSSDLTLECQFVPIRFYWRDCGDNTMSDISGNSLYLANQVIDPVWGLLMAPGDDLEYGYYGPADDCYEVVQHGRPPDLPFKGPLGGIVYENGGIKIICIVDIDDRGDVNLNGIDYEVADAVVFTNYFIVGMAAFTINPAGQMAATDVNADGTPLSVADLVYLIRIIIGDALPYASAIKLTPGDPINVGFNGDIVDLRGTTDVGAALFVFDREITPTLTDNANHMTIRYGYMNGRTNVLVYSMEHRSLSAGDILSIEGKANLVDVEAADYFGAPLTVDKTIIVPTEFALLQNYPNPFNPETVVGLALPVASNWNIAIYNVSGQLVKEFSGYSEAGVVQVTWDATDVASGMYFYKATTDQFSATKKMVLLK